MLKVKASQLKPGMIVAEAIYDGGTFPLVNEGVPLTQLIIDNLKYKGIGDIYLEVPEDLSGAADLEIFTPRKNLSNYGGRVYVRGELRPSLRITSDKSIIVSGNIREGCHIESGSGNISVKGSLQGTEECHINVIAGKDIVIQQAAVVVFVTIRTLGDVTIEADVKNARISASNITIKGLVTASQVTALQRIKVNECDSGDSECKFQVEEEGQRCITILGVINPKTIIAIGGRQAAVTMKTSCESFSLIGDRIISQRVSR